MQAYDDVRCIVPIGEVYRHQAIGDLYMIMPVGTDLDFDGDTRPQMRASIRPGA